MVDAAGALQRALRRRLVVEVAAAALVAARLPAAVHRLELERLEQDPAGLGGGAVGADGVEAPQGQVGRDLGVVGDQRLVWDSTTASSWSSPSGSAKSRPSAARGGTRRRCAPSRSSQKSSDSCEPTRQTIRCTLPAPGPARRHAGVLKEGEVGAGAALLVGEEEVIDGRVVLVDGFLDQAQAQHPGVEVDVALSVVGDRGDVVDSLQLHWSRIASRR